MLSDTLLQVSAYPRLVCCVIPASRSSIRYVSTASIGLLPFLRVPPCPTSAASHFSTRSIIPYVCIGSSIRQ
eukprot:3764544-Rhodomonas_salina.1